MTDAKTLYEAGDLAAAIEEVTREVKAHPSDAARRTFLFELLCFAGEWERADKQLEVIGHQSAGAEIGVQVYRNNLKAEHARRRLFTDGLSPHFLIEPPPYVDLHLEALNRLREGNTQEARATLDRAEEERPAVSGTLNDTPFEDFRDYDDRFAPVLEVIIQDKYTWVPFEQIKRLEITAPEQLRDLVWATAQIETVDKELKAFLPMLYAETSRHTDDAVKLGRMTDWTLLSNELYAGAGLRLFAVDGEEKPMLQVRNLSFDRGENVEESGGEGGTGDEQSDSAVG